MDTTLSQAPDLDGEQLRQLQESEWDLSVELQDLEQEIAERGKRLAVVLSLLRQTRADIRALTTRAAA